MDPMPHPYYSQPMGNSGLETDWQTGVPMSVVEAQRQQLRQQLARQEQVLVQMLLKDMTDGAGSIVVTNTVRGMLECLVIAIADPDEESVFRQIQEFRARLNILRDCFKDLPHDEKFARAVILQFVVGILGMPEAIDYLATPPAPTPKEDSLHGRQTYSSDL